LAVPSPDKGFAEEIKTLARLGSSHPGGMTCPALTSVTVKRSVRNGAPMAQSMYEITVAGIVPEADLADMRAVKIVPDQAKTLLYGISDQAALSGLLSRLNALGIDVVEVRRVSNLPVEVDGPAPADPGDRR
jgi:hypothetical protein